MNVVTGQQITYCQHSAIQLGHHSRLHNNIKDITLIKMAPQKKLFKLARNIQTYTHTLQ